VFLLLAFDMPAYAAYVFSAWVKKFVVLFSVELW